MSAYSGMRIRRLIATLPSVSVKTVRTRSQSSKPSSSNFLSPLVCLKRGPCFTSLFRTCNACGSRGACCTCGIALLPLPSSWPWAKSDAGAGTCATNAAGSASSTATSSWSLRSSKWAAMCAGARPCIIVKGPMRKSAEFTSDCRSPDSFLNVTFPWRETALLYDCTKTVLVPAGPPETTRTQRSRPPVCATYQEPTCTGGGCG
mmetsp:Transcript_106193/g.226692  ORF Transcript_106193/g.226692 Transcript_106193/m.226692 type:complete len:204 (+) Transcript_106193:229-840(+)